MSPARAHSFDRRGVSQVRLRGSTARRAGGLGPRAALPPAWGYSSISASAACTAPPPDGNRLTPLGTLPPAGYPADV